jgi:prepilin-type N-terminal cleavage/methylation domain-containing protein
MTARRFRARRGMTLMELMVGLVITGLVAMVGATAFYSIIDHRYTVIQSTIDTERASALREMLRTWIGSASIQIQSGGAQGRNTLTTYGPSGIVRRTTITTGREQQSDVPSITAAASTGDEITFLTNALTPAMTPNTRVRLFVDGDAATPEVGLTIEFQASTATPLQRRQLDSTIVMMTVEFLDGTTNRWVPYSEAATIRATAARLYFPPVENYSVPELLQYPLLFVIQPPTQEAQGGRGGG